jgi:hypothetical protein
MSCTISAIVRSAASDPARDRAQGPDGVRRGAGQHSPGPVCGLAITSASASSGLTLLEFLKIVAKAVLETGGR